MSQFLHDDNDAKAVVLPRISPITAELINRG